MRGEPWLKPPVIAKPSGDGMWDLVDADMSPLAFHMREIDAKAVAALIEAAAHLPINGSGTRVWPGKVQWVMFVDAPPERMDVHSWMVDDRGRACVAMRMPNAFVQGPWFYATELFDTEAEAMAARKGAE